MEGSKTQILDTRKTLPGSRLAQKYAVQVGGGSNHRIGLFDAFLIKENHIVAAGGIAEAISRARTMNPSLRLEIEVESLDELSAAIAAKPDWIMLDNFDNESLQRAIAMTPSSIKLEVSGGIKNDDDIKRIAALGVDYISRSNDQTHPGHRFVAANDHRKRLTALKEPSIDHTSHWRH